MPESAVLEGRPGPAPPEAKAPDLVPLDPDHPGFRDAEYRARRNTIARLAFDYSPGDPVPEVAYTEEEQAVWREVNALLDPRHRERACAEYRECARAVALDRDRIPQLEEVNRTIRPATGFRMLPVAGLVTPRAFLACLADRVFLSTQYIRHHSRPLYTPEPDVIHELVGHAASFAHRGYADLSAHFGRAAKAATDEEVEQIARTYWFTLEFGAALEDGEVKAYGAGILSSIGEIDRFAAAELRPYTAEATAATEYDPTMYQPCYFLAASFDEMVERTTRFLRRFSD